MKIGYIIADWKLPVLGATGAAVHIREICSALGRLGHEVFILAAAKQGAEEAVPRAIPPIYEIRPQIRLPSSSYHVAERIVSRLSGKRAPKAVRTNGATHTTWALRTVCADILRNVGERLWHYYFYRQARSILEKEKPDVLYERYERASIVGLKLAKEYGLPLILEMNSSRTFSEERRHKHSPLYTYWATKAEKEICRRADRILVVSPYLENHLLDLGIDSEKIVLMPNAAEPERYYSTNGHTGQIREKYGLHRKIVVGFIGSFRPWLDLDLLLDSAKLLLNYHHPVHFLLVGDGASRTRLESRVQSEGLSNHVTFTGYVPQDEAPAYINAMDITVAPYPRLPSFHFSPLKIFEYMAAAKPVIASRYPDIEAIIEDEHNGILVEPGAVGALTQAILELLEDKELRQRLGYRARCTVQEKHTWKRNAEQIVKLYEEVHRRRY